MPDRLTESEREAEPLTHNEREALLAAWRIWKEEPLLDDRAAEIAGLVRVAIAAVPRLGSSVLDTLEKERDQLRKFVAKVVGEWSWGHNVDGGDVQDLAEELGLIVKLPHDPKCSDEDCPCEAMGCDHLYWLAWSEQARRATPTKGESDG